MQIAKRKFLLYSSPTGCDCPFGRRAFPHGFTVVELLVLLSILCILMALLLPLIRKGLISARLTVCANNLHQHHTGAANYAGDFYQFLPVYPYLDPSILTNDNYICLGAGPRETTVAGTYTDYSTVKMPTGLYAFEMLGYIDPLSYNCPGAAGKIYRGLAFHNKDYCAVNYGFRYNSRRTIWATAEQTEAGERVDDQAKGAANVRWLRYGIPHIRSTFTRPARAHWALFADQWAGQSPPHNEWMNVVRCDGGVQAIPALPTLSSDPYSILPYKSWLDPFLR